MKSRVCRHPKKYCCLLCFKIPILLFRYWYDPVELQHLQQCILRVKIVSSSLLIYVYYLNNHSLVPVLYHLRIPICDDVDSLVLQVSAMSHGYRNNKFPKTAFFVFPIAFLRCKSLQASLVSKAFHLRHPNFLWYLYRYDVFNICFVWILTATLIIGLNGGRTHFAFFISIISL